MRFGFCPAAPSEPRPEGCPAYSLLAQLSMCSLVTLAIAEANALRPGARAARHRCIQSLVVVAVIERPARAATLWPCSLSRVNRALAPPRSIPAPPSLARVFVPPPRKCASARLRRRREAAEWATELQCGVLQCVSRGAHVRVGDGGGTAGRRTCISAAFLFGLRAARTTAK